EDPLIRVARFISLPEFLVGTPQEVVDPEQLSAPALGEPQRTLQYLERDGMAPFEDETVAELLVDLEGIVDPSQRELELRDRLVVEPHLLEGEPEVVAAVRILLVQVLFDLRPELMQQLEEVPVLVPGRDRRLDGITRLAPRGLFALYQRSQVDEPALRTG